MRDRLFSCDDEGPRKGVGTRCETRRVCVGTKLRPDLPPRTCLHFFMLIFQMAQLTTFIVSRRRWKLTIYMALYQVLALLRCKADILRTRREAMHVLILALQNTFEKAGTARCRAQGHVPRSKLHSSSGIIEEKGVLLTLANHHTLQYDRLVDNAVPEVERVTRLRSILECGIHGLWVHSWS